MATKRILLKIVLVLAVLVVLSQTYIKPVAGSKNAFGVTIPDIAARCKGEADFAIVECVCTVKERLENGWSMNRVLWHYYAPSITPTPDEIKLAGDVLDGSLACPDGMYYMFSSSDIMGLGLRPADATVVVASGNKRIYIYPIDTFRTRRDN